MKKVTKENLPKIADKIQDELVKALSVFQSEESYSYGIKRQEDEDDEFIKLSVYSICKTHKYITQPAIEECIEVFNRFKNYDVIYYGIDSVRTGLCMTPALTITISVPYV